MPMPYRARRAVLSARALARDFVAQVAEMVDNVEAWTLGTSAPVVDLCLVSYQYRENYAAHDWDGEGECPQYWKCKGGSDVIVPVPEGWTLGDVVEALSARYEWSNPYSAQHVLGAERVRVEDVQDEYHAECADWVPESFLHLAA